MADKLQILHVASWFPSQVHASLGNFILRHIDAISSVHGGEVWAPVPVCITWSKGCPNPNDGRSVLKLACCPLENANGPRWTSRLTAFKRCGPADGEGHLAFLAFR